MIKSDVIIGKILDNAEVGEGMDILDVACGTGVMFDYYLQRGVASVTGIDIAPEMAKIAAQKYADENKVQVLCGDVEEFAFDRKWFWGGVALQFATGFTVSYLVYQIGTLITTGALGAGFLPGLIAVAVFAAVIVILISKANAEITVKK